MSGDEQRPEPKVPVVEIIDTPAARTGRRPRLVIALAAAIVALVVVAAGEIVYLVRDPSPAVSADRPVVAGDVTTRTAVDAAARSTEQILSTTYQDYDQQVDQATSKMTGTFAKKYRELAESLAEKYTEQKMKLTVKAVEQGVVQASSKEVKALLFLNQYVEKVEDGEPKTGFAQYRALVTVVHTSHGWLVSDLETQ
jgi:Mce-associated membrane protein